MREKIYVYDPRRHRRVLAGYLKDRTFYKRDSNMLLVPKGWAFDKMMIDDLIRLNKIDYLVCKYEHITYRAIIKDLGYAHIFDRGHGVQYCLTLDYWEVNNPKQRRMLNV